MVTALARRTSLACVDHDAGSGLVVTSGDTGALRESPFCFTSRFTTTYTSPCHCPLTCLCRQARRRRPTQALDEPRPIDLDLVTQRPPDAFSVNPPRSRRPLQPVIAPDVGDPHPISVQYALIDLHRCRESPRTWYRRFRRRAERSL